MPLPDDLFRFVGIVHPLRSKFLRDNKHVAQLTLAVWIFSLLCASPNLLYLRVLRISPTRRSCLLHYSSSSVRDHRRAYIIHKSLESTIFYFLPLLLQIYCYTRIARKLYRIDETLSMSMSLPLPLSLPLVERCSVEEREVNPSFCLPMTVTCALEVCWCRSVDERQQVSDER